MGRSTRVLGNIELPTPLNYIHWRSSIRVEVFHPGKTSTFIEDLQYGLKSSTMIKLLHVLKIFVKDDDDDDDDDDHDHDDDDDDNDNNDE